MEPSSIEPCPPNDLLLDQVHSLIDALGKLAPKVVKAKAMGQALEEEEEPGEDGDAGDAKISLQMSNALHTVNELWQRHTGRWSLNPQNRTNSRVNLAQQKTTKPQSRERQAGKDPKAMQCGAYLRLKKANISTWWRKVRNGKTPPTPE